MRIAKARQFNTRSFIQVVIVQIIYENWYSNTLFFQK